MRALLELANVSSELLPQFEAAFVHESAAREREIISNERLEFLGDSILGFLISTWLYQTYTDDVEGTLAKRKAALVSDVALAASARRLGFGDLVQLGAGERASGGAERTSILADAFEAFIAVLFIAAGMQAAAHFIYTQHVAFTDHGPEAILDPKTVLQELTQERYACTPSYREEGEGPPHQRRFTSYVSVQGELLGTGTGGSKKAAQQEAAAAALRILQTRQDQP